eukprot:4228214-Amphidinium_carterae.2
MTGAMQAGITLRDLVHAIPLAAIEIGLLTVPKKNKKNVFAGQLTRTRTQSLLQRGATSTGNREHLIGSRDYWYVLVPCIWFSSCAKDRQQTIHVHGLQTC